MIKLLTSTDSILLKKFFEESKKTDPAIRDSELLAWEFYIDKLTKDNNDCLIFACIESDRIVRAYFTITVDCLFDTKVKVFPYWISTLVRTLSSSKTPVSGFEELYLTGIKEYESRGYNTFYNVVQIPKHYDSMQINTYLNRTYPKIIGKPIRYEYILDSVIDNPNNYNGFKLFKMIIPKNISENKKVLIVRHELKSSFRR